MTTQGREKPPNPGSDEARAKGCTCPVMDNWRGSDEIGRIRGFVMFTDCPLHGSKPDEQGSTKSKNATKGNDMKRQGDILIVPVNEIPEGLKEVPRQKGQIVLAEGELTGHLHAIDSPEATFRDADLEEIEGRFLEIEAEVELTHPEHDTIVLEPGKYEVRRQKSYGMAGGIDYVAD